MDNNKYQYEGMKWLHEHELVNHPQAVNNIKFNILMVSSRIKEVELLIYREKKSMLVLLDLTWIGKKFFRKRIFSEVQESLSLLLPSFRFRVIDDPKIMELAVEKVKQALTGGTYENNSNPSDDASKPNSPTANVTPDASEQRAPSASTSDQEKQPEFVTLVHPDVIKSDSGKK